MAPRVPLLKLGGSTSALDSASYLRQFSKDNHKDQKYYAKMRDKVKAKAQEIFQVRNLSEKFEPTRFYLTKVESHSQQACGKITLSKLYTVVPVMTQIAVILWKIGYLDSARDESAFLAKVLPFSEMTHSMLNNLQ